MAKDPAFLFYPNDYLGGTMGMTFEQKGAYIELLMVQFNRGHMDGHMIGQVVGQIWDEISDKFEKDQNGKYYNVRLEEEQNRRKSYTQSRKNNLKGVNQHSKDIAHMGGHTTTRMETENEDRDITINTITNRKEKFKKNLVPFIEKYSLNMIIKFESYWTEHNPAGKKMRYEYAKNQPFDISRRLQTWAKNQKRFEKEPSAKTSVKEIFNERHGLNY